MTLAPPAAPAARDHALTICFVVTFVAALQFGMQFPLLNLTLDDWGLSERDIGLFTLSAAVSSLILAPFAPSVIARVSSRQALGAACLALAMIALLYLAFPNPTAWFALRFLGGLAIGLVFVVSEAWILDRAPEAQRGRVLGVYATCLAGGVALGSGVIALVGHTGATPFLVSAGLALAALLPLGLPGRGLSAPDAAEARPSALWARMRAAPLVMLAPVAMGAIETAKYNLLPIYARRVGFGDDAAAALVAAAGAGVFCLQLALGAAADRLGARRVLIACAVSGVIAPFVIFAVGGSYWAAAAAVFVYSGLVTGLYTIGLMLLAARFQAGALAAANAAYVMCYGLGQVAGPAVAGASFASLGPLGFMAGLAAPAALYLCALVFFRPPAQRD